MPTSDASADQTKAQPEGAGGELISRSVLTSGITIAGVALAAVTFAVVVGPWTSARGVVGPLVADAERPLLAIGATLAAFAVSTALAAVVAKMVNAVVGLFVLGCGVGMLAMRGGTSLDFVSGGSSVLAAAAELAAWTVLVAAASHVLFRVGGRLPDLPETHEVDIDSPTGFAARKSWLAGIAALVAAWIAAATFAKGQAVFAGVLGGFAAGAVGRFLAPRTTPVYLAAAPVAAFAAAFAFIGFTMKGDLAAGWVDGSMPRLMRLMPVDIAAGALAGVSLGFGFARGFTSSADD